jgi:hypothetical protein
VLNTCSSFVGASVHVGYKLDRPEHSVQVDVYTAQVQREAEIWGRFGQESRSFGQSGTTGARYANRAKPHKHWLFRILLIWRVGT